MNILERAIDYIKTSQLELKKVVWPSKKEITQHTLLVIGISLFVALFLFLADSLLNYLLTFLIK